MTILCGNVHLCVWLLWFMYRARLAHPSIHPSIQRAGTIRSPSQALLCNFQCTIPTTSQSPAQSIHPTHACPALPAHPTPSPRQKKRKRGSGSHNSKPQILLINAAPPLPSLIKPHYAHQSKTREKEAPSSSKVIYFPISPAPHALDSQIRTSRIPETRGAQKPRGIGA
ncbi:hypothetical protein BS50DRAFT_375642 [Corynespora cassiicola Philippines]|uniref:Uncharacterized protein n=1 Tax=Corynespora cassiicola Philippines TaxID=1448308 RepID=A0A2T2NN44_CORCC|nr:hypothetical protein BS50DRAFT_375642 [Corynespora cassiicola Philippines]